VLFPLSCCCLSLVGFVTSWSRDLALGLIGCKLFLHRNEKHVSWLCMDSEIRFIEVLTFCLLQVIVLVACTMCWHCKGLAIHVWYQLHDMVDLLGCAWMVSDMELVVSRMQVSQHILLQQLLPPLPFLDKIQPHLQILGIDGSFLVRAIQIKSEWPFFFYLYWAWVELISQLWASKYGSG